MKNWLLVAVLLALPVLGFWLVQKNSARHVVVYCAHDSIHAETLLKKFEEISGITVEVRYDTEATKSLGLVETLSQEKDKARCDVFWNNELLGTMRLAREGVFEPWVPQNASRIPEAYRDSQGRWTGFAARARVLLAWPAVSDTELDANADFFRPATAGKAAFAKPLYGTTRTHATALWAAMGSLPFQKLLKQCMDQGLRLVDGNSLTARLVAERVSEMAFTDTDDAAGILEKNPELKWRLVSIDQKTILIPNTVSLIQGAPHSEEGQELIEFLLSAEAEMALAQGKARQLPLGPVDEAELPPFVREWQKKITHHFDLRDLEKVDEACLEWLKSQEW